MNKQYQQQLARELDREGLVIFYLNQQFALIQTHSEENFEYSVWDDSIEGEPDDGGFINIPDSNLALDELVQRLV